MIVSGFYHSKDEQRLLETVTGMAERGERPPAVRRKWRTLDERIKRLKRQYRRDERTLEQFWEAVQHVIVNFE